MIAIVALLVFGPDRLPELSRKAGELLTKAREMTRSFTDSLDSEFDEVTSPIRTLKSEYHATKDELTGAAGTILNFDGPPDPGNADGETPKAESSDAEPESSPTSKAASQSPLEDEVPDAQDRDTE